MLVPTSAEQHGPTDQVQAIEEVGGDRLGARDIDGHTRHVGHPGQVETGEVVTVSEAVERRVEVGAGVRHHVDAPDLKLVAGRVPLPRRGPAEVVGDGRPGQPGIGDGPVGDRVAEVDDVGHRHVLSATSSHRPHSSRHVVVRRSLGQSGAPTTTWRTCA